jgi:hypothetical protein
MKSRVIQGDPWPRRGARAGQAGGPQDDVAVVDLRTGSTPRPRAEGDEVADVAELSSPWRWRARAALATYAVVSFVYAGVLWDLEHLLAVVTGLALGPLLLGRRPRPALRRLSRQDSDDHVDDAADEEADGSAAAGPPENRPSRPPGSPVSALGLHCDGDKAPADPAGDVMDGSMTRGDQDEDTAGAACPGRPAPCRNDRGRRSP